DVAMLTLDIGLDFASAGAGAKLGGAIIKNTGWFTSVTASGQFVQVGEHITSGFRFAGNVEVTASRIGSKVAQVAEMEAANVAKGIKAANGLKISRFTKHGVNRAIGAFGRKGVKPEAILDALKNPLKINNVVTDQFGRQSQRFIGRFGEVVVNPQTGRIISVNPTSSSKALRLLK